MSTTLAKPDIKKQWYVVDAEGQPLGRLAVKIANLLRGRGKPIYTHHIDTGDFVIVINAEKVTLSGKKEEQKQYMFYSGYRGNEKYVSYANMKAKHPDFIIKHAVEGMLPKNKLARDMIKKLKIFKGPEHTHEAQTPIPFEV